MQFFKTIKQVIETLFKIPEYSYSLLWAKYRFIEGKKDAQFHSLIKKFDALLFNLRWT